jgi:hypothetical protein
VKGDFVKKRFSVMRINSRFLMAANNSGKDVVKRGTMPPVSASPWSLMGYGLS